jgi:hypothetical protein
LEISDGSANITGTGIYAENCAYAVDVQDHGQEQEVNRNITLTHLYAKDSKHVLRTANHGWPHYGLTIRDVTAENCRLPLHLSNTLGVLVENVRIFGHFGNLPAIRIINCSHITVRDVLYFGGTAVGPAILVQDTGGLLLENVTVTDQMKELSHAVRYELSNDTTRSNIWMRNIHAPNTVGAAILFVHKEEGGTGRLENYRVTESGATFRDELVKLRE